MSIGRNDPAVTVVRPTTLVVMNPMEHHPSQYRRATQQETARVPAPAVPREIQGHDADCCSARPLFRVVLPVNAERRTQAEFYLCGHHHRRCHASLVAANASTFDAVGRVIGNG